MVAADTNVLVYAEKLGELSKQQRADQILQAVPRRNFVLAAQVLGELFRVLRRKTTLAPVEVRRKIEDWQSQASIAPTAETTIQSALVLASENGLQIFDAIILAAASETGCRLLLSEDMQDGLVWRGVTVANPFAQTLHPMVADLMRG